MSGNDRRAPPTPHVQARMRKQGRAHTVPEIALRRALRQQGLGYRLGRPVPGMPRRSIDISFLGPRVAVFVDGCFWHRCPQHTVPAKNNAAWWARKLEDNVQRDRETTLHLEALGWIVVRVWEHEDMYAKAAMIAEVVRALRRGNGGMLPVDT